MFQEICWKILRILGEIKLDAKMYGKFEGFPRQIVQNRRRRFHIAAFWRWKKSSVSAAPDLGTNPKGGQTNFQTRRLYTYIYILYIIIKNIFYISIYIL